MFVVIAGATGFIGKALCRRLRGEYEVVALSRNVQRAAKSLGALARVVEWDGRAGGRWEREIDGALAIVNLAGENVASRRWTKDRKHRILKSRAESARVLAQAVAGAAQKPRVFVQASAVGYYGPRGDEALSETSPAGEGFLAHVCKQAEQAAQQVESSGVRCVAIRTGVVLGPNGGALEKLARSFKFFLGGYIGSGNQWLSWISLDDEVAAIEYLIENKQLSGPFNLTSPEPATMKDFSRTLGRVLGRASWTVVPGFVLRLALGEMADEMLLQGQRVMPSRLIEAGFEFKAPNLQHVLTEILKGDSE